MDRSKHCLDVKRVRLFACKTIACTVNFVKNFSINMYVHVHHTYLLYFYSFDFYFRYMYCVHTLVHMCVGCTVKT